MPHILEPIHFTHASRSLLDGATVGKVASESSSGKRFVVSELSELESNFHIHNNVGSGSEGEVSNSITIATSKYLTKSSSAGEFGFTSRNL